MHHAHDLQHWACFARKREAKEAKEAKPAPKAENKTGERQNYNQKRRRRGGAVVTQIPMNRGGCPGGVPIPLEKIKSTTTVVSVGSKGVKRFRDQFASLARQPVSCRQERPRRSAKHRVNKAPASAVEQPNRRLERTVCAADLELVGREPPVFERDKIEGGQQYYCTSVTIADS